MHNDRLDRLTDYPFDRLRTLLRGIDPPDPAAAVAMHIGEPQHAAPAAIADTLARHVDEWGSYPPPAGTADYRAAAADWLTSRYRLPNGFIDPDTNVVAVAGTREALFLAALATVSSTNGVHPVVVLPNPFYQVYFGAALIAGAEPVLLPATAATNHQPDLTVLPADLLDRTAMVYLNSPANPQGSVIDRASLAAAIDLARAHDFILVVDECYAEIYCAAPPLGAMQVCAATGSCANVVVFHSLSKRSNAAGLRCGFVAGDPAWIRHFLHLRQYAGALIPRPIQAAAAALWRDESHVNANRALYRRKFALAAERLGPVHGATPGGAFYLWLDVGDGEAVAKRLWRDVGIKVMPGAYLARPYQATPGAALSNPGAAYIRVALVHDIPTTERALDHFAAILGSAPCGAATIV